MTTMPDESFVNFALIRELQQAEGAGVIHSNTSIDSSKEENHLSELERRLQALDEVENYVAVKTVIKNNKKLFVNILEYLNKKEGEKA